MFAAPEETRIVTTIPSTRPTEPPTPRGSWLRAVEARIRRPVASGSYNAEIDGLRFIAIAIVVVGHFMERGMRFFPAARAEVEGNPFAALLLRPGYGVYLFFAISGFIITRQVIKAKSAPLGGQFLRAYFGRRILRIEPPYIVLLVGTWLLISLSGYKPEQTNHFDAVPGSLGASLLGSVFYVHDLVWGTYPRLFPPGWSLEIEVQFYVSAPLLFWAFLRARSVGAKAALGAVGLFGGVLLSHAAPRHVGAAHTDASILLFFHFFWLGIVLAHMRGWIAEKTAALSPFMTGAVGWLGLLCYVTMPNAPDDDIIVAMAIRAAMLAALTAVFVSAFAPGSSFRAFCERPWVSLIGGACYSIYLTHLQVIQATTSVLAKLAPRAGLAVVSLYLAIEVVLVLAVGMAFYVVVERPFMIKDWPARAGRLLRVSRIRVSETGRSSSHATAGRLGSASEPN